MTKKALIPKDKGHGMVISAFVRQDFGHGHDPTP